VAPYFLPKTSAIFGRAGNPCSHWLFQTNLHATRKVANVEYNDPTAGKDQKAVIVELRIGGGGKGAQTVFPGSTHETGEEIHWDHNGEPAAVDGDHLHQRVARLAAAALLARYWSKSTRHKAARALGGMFAHSGWIEAQAKLFVEAVAKAAGDDEWRDRIKAVEDSFATFRAGCNVEGLPRLTDYLDERVARRAAEWLDIVTVFGTRKAQPASGLAPTHEGNWKDHLIRDGNGKPLPILANAMVAMRGAPELIGAFSFDEMLRAVVLEHSLPSNIEHLPLLKSGLDCASPPLRDTDVTQVQEWLQHQGLRKIGRDTVHQAIELRAAGALFSSRSRLPERAEVGWLRAAPELA
jgi:hypothetical protein